MAVLTPLTILVEFLPPIIVTLGYLLLFGKRRNRFIEAFVILMYIKSITFFIFNIWFLPEYTPGGFNPDVDGGTLLAVLFADFMFHFGYAIQEYFTWIMVSFMAVLFGQAVIMLKLALQDPLKMKFSNVIKRVAGREPVSDGYSGLGDRLDHITFEGVEPQPLDPDVVKKAWSESWKDYLIIGLATLLPSIGLYMDASLDPYAYSILVFLTWIYRFGYPASNRIAKGAGIKLGDRDLGGEMMRGVLGWFFRLNLLLSVGTIVLGVYNAIANDTLASLGTYYLTGLVLAAPPILFAILLLPLSEDFSVVLYKRTFDSIRNARKKLGGMSKIGTLKNIASAGFTSLLVIGAFVGSVIAVCLNYAFTQLGVFRFVPTAVDGAVVDSIFNAFDNQGIIAGNNWVLLMLLIPMGMMIFLGVMSHFVRRYIKGGTEGFAFFSGLFVSTSIWLLIPGMDYILQAPPIAVRYMGNLFYRMVPIVVPPSPGQELLRFAFQFVFALPMFISVALFTLYYFRFRESWRESIGEVSGPTLNVHSRDIRDSVGLFVIGIVGSVIGVVVLSLFMPISALGDLIWSLIFEIGQPNGLELVLANSVSFFWIVVEHNVIRTLLMLVAGPILWTVILWLIGVQAKETGDRKIGIVSFIMLIVAGVASYLWTTIDMAAGVFIPALNYGDPSWPWTFAAQLGFRAAILYGVLFGAYFLIIIINHFGRGKLGGWWLPPLLTLFAIEYFVYDDQFTLIALIILPMILAVLYKAVSTKPEVRQEDLLLTYIRFSLMSLAIAEILSTALWVAGLGAVTALQGGSITFYLAGILPHGIIEIPAFLFAAAASIRIARELAPTIQAEDWASIPSKTKELLTDARLWRTYLLVIFFLAIAALIEEHITWIIQMLFI